MTSSVSSGAHEIKIFDLIIKYNKIKYQVDGDYPHLSFVIEQ